MTAKIYLKVVERQNGDSVVKVMRGDNPHENLACGSCKAVIGRGMSTRVAYETIRTTTRLLIECQCGAFNLVPTQKASRPK